MKVQTYHAMWSYGHHFRTKSTYYREQTRDCGMFVAFDQTSDASSSDTNQIEVQLDYVGTI